MHKVHARQEIPKSLFSPQVFNHPPSPLPFDFAQAGSTRKGEMNLRGHPSNSPAGNYGSPLYLMVTLPWEKSGTAG